MANPSAFWRWLASTCLPAREARAGESEKGSLMTGDELDRAIQFLLESQAKNDAQIGRLTGDSAELKALLRDFAETTQRFAERADERLDRNDAQISRLTGDFADFKASVGEFVESTRRFAERADERLERLEENAKRNDGRLQRLETALANLAERTDKLAEEMSSLLHVVEGHVTDETRHRRPPG